MRLGPEMLMVLRCTDGAKPLLGLLPCQYFKMRGWSEAPLEELRGVCVSPLKSFKL